MTHRLHLTILAAGVLAGVSAAAVAIELPRHESRTVACLAIAQGVCLSGPTEWVAKAASAMPREGHVMVAMAGDAN